MGLIEMCPHGEASVFSRRPPESEESVRFFLSLHSAMSIRLIGGVFPRFPRYSSAHCTWKNAVKARYPARKGWLQTLAVFACSVSALTASSDEPEFRLLKFAQWLHGDGAGEIQLVQNVEEIRQPTDFDSIAPRVASADSSRAGRTRLSFDSVSEATAPALASGSSGSVEQSAPIIEALTQEPISTGVAQTAPVEIVPASSYSLANVPDVTQSIVQSATTPTVKARRRSPISLEPRIRGYAGGQIYTTMDGGFIGPVRNDLDGVLSKTDKSLIASTEIISGPYGLRYGNGFSFMTVDTIPTPRSECGWENHLRLGTHVRTNGGQTYNTATLSSAGQRAGFYANVGYRKGSDYTAGNGLKIPSSYDAFNIFSAIGFDIDSDTRMVTRFNRLNQGETEYAAQFFDVNDLDFYGISHSIIHQDDRTGRGYRIDGWVSDTEFQGDTTLDGKRRADFPVLQRVDDALRAASGSTTIPDDAVFVGDVEGEITIAGIRAGLRKEFDEETSISGGADIRYIRQEITENFDISQFESDPTAAQFSSGLPTAEMIDPGFYGEFASGMTEHWNIATGARLAFASTSADPNAIDDQSNFRDLNGDIIRDLDVSDIVGSWYLTNDLELTRAWRGRVGAGYAERLPDLTERYSDGLFLSVIQSGFSRVIGNPELDKERNWQVDFRLDGEYEDVRIRLSSFHAWIDDYITYAANAVDDPDGSRLLQAINTDQATLLGLEGYTELDLTDAVQAFGSVTYLDGRDQQINQPLPNIYPLESRVGLRWSDTNPENAWGWEWGWRLVDAQNDLGTLRPVQAAGVDPIRLEESTPGFAVSYIRGYISPSDGVNLTMGVENLFDRNYFEHLNLRLPAQGTGVNGTPGNFGRTTVFSPGITPYFGVEVEY